MDDIFSAIEEEDGQFMEPIEQVHTFLIELIVESDFLAQVQCGHPRRHAQMMLTRTAF